MLNKNYQNNYLKNTRSQFNYCKHFSVIFICFCICNLVKTALKQKVEI